MLESRRLQEQVEQVHIQPQLTVGERIFEHLRGLQTDGLLPMDAWPFSATQDGIAEAIGISRAHAALELKRLGNRIQELVAHVEGGKSRRRVYRVDPNPMTISDRAGRPLPIARGDRTTLDVVVFRCPHCSKVARVALND